MWRARRSWSRRSGTADREAILLDLGASADLDIGTSDMLRDLTSDLRRANIDLLLAQVRGSVRERMRVTGLFDHIGEGCMFPTIAAAVSAYEAGAFKATTAQPAAPSTGRLQSEPFQARCS